MAELEPHPGGDSHSCYLLAPWAELSGRAGKWVARHSWGLESAPLLQRDLES